MAMNFRKLVLLAGCAFAFAGNAIAQSGAKTDAQSELMLLYQRSYGGWPKTQDGKKLDYTHPHTDVERAAAARHRDDRDATIDNKATTREIVHLIKAYGLTQNERYLAAAKRGLDYLLDAQHDDNGGWPQYFPDARMYRAQVTYNDGAMINVMSILLDVVRGKDEYAALAEYKPRAQAALEKGVACVLKTQVVLNGTLTAWAAQYDEKTLQPAKARAFELPALASAESAGVVKFLMRLESPDTATQRAIVSAIKWFDAVKIRGYRAEHVDAPGEETGRDFVLVRDDSAVVWARFYDLEKCEPLFVGRDGVPRKKLSEIDNERRAGYAWYGEWGASLPAQFAKWKKKNGIN